MNNVSDIYSLDHRQQVDLCIELANRVTMPNGQNVYELLDSDSLATALLSADSYAQGNPYDADIYPLLQAVTNDRNDDLLSATSWKNMARVATAELVGHVFFGNVEGTLRKLQFLAVSMVRNEHADTVRETIASQYETTVTEYLEWVAEGMPVTD